MAPSCFCIFQLSGWALVAPSCFCTASSRCIYEDCILANRPGISGTVPETDLLSCCPGNNRNCPENHTRGLGVYYVQASLSDKLLPADECQYQWVRTVRTSVQEGHASGIPIGSAIMCPQAEREPLSSVVNSLQTTLGMLQLCSGSKLSCTRQQNPAK